VTSSRSGDACCAECCRRQLLHLVARMPAPKHNQSEAKKLPNRGHAERAQSPSFRRGEKQEAGIVASGAAATKLGGAGSLGLSPSTLAALVDCEKLKLEIDRFFE